MNLLYVPFSLFYRIPFLSPELHIRLSNRLCTTVLSRAIGISFALSVYILLSYVIISVGFTFKIVLNTVILIVFYRLVTFIYACCMLNQLVYVITRKQILGVLVAPAINLLFSVVIISVEYYTPYKNIGLFVLSTYTTIINVCGSIILYSKLEKLEVISTI